LSLGQKGMKVRAVTLYRPSEVVAPTWMGYTPNWS